jgi:bifunctional non-homologous end joining protein LigD
MPARRPPGEVIGAQPEDLKLYRAKRSAQRTPEPFGGGLATQAGSHLFVVQKHAARRTHWDLRLELGGVLKSWAVPKGPSRDPGEKRLAVEVEDHPLEYADFEGVIPEGNYGAGRVIVWDTGRWEPVEDPDEGLRKGKLLFDLHGYKLRGRWTLVRTKGKGGTPQKEWLLIKKHDSWSASEGGSGFSQASVLSGLTLEELVQGGERAAALRAQLEHLRAPHRRVHARDVGLMLADTAERPFSGHGWIFELKYDGYRLLAERGGDRVELRFRGGHDATPAFPEIRRALLALPLDDFLLDGEVVVLDREGRPSFQSLQKRVQLRRPAEIERERVTLPATLFVFDLLACGGFDLRPLPLLKRKELLRLLVPVSGPLRFADHVEERGEDLFRAARDLGLEGLVAKAANTPYKAGRSKSWLKLRVDQTGDFAVVGFTEPRGSRAGLGALHLALREGDHWVYAGRVGTGMSDRQLRELRERLLPTVRSSLSLVGAVPKGREHHWVEPTLVCEVRFKEWTRDGVLRQPAFLRLRDDKTPSECVREERRPPDAPQTPEVEEPQRTVAFTNLKKIFWPKEGYTKGDLIEFYRSVSGWILPYLRERPLVMTRYPDGITGKSFFQKDAPGFAPSWLRTERIWSEHAGREIDYFVCDDEASLLYVANLGTIPLHIWASRVPSLAQPDWCILDLDPKGAPFAHVVELALAIRRLCDELDLPAGIKTSGASGLHILIPLAGQCTFEQCRGLAELLARVVEAEHPEIATTARSLPSRHGRVYIDYLQNGHGRLLVAPLSVRPLPGAPVSTPLHWREVGRGLRPEKFTIRTVPTRLRRLGDDPLRAALDLRPNLQAALARLSERLRSGEPSPRKSPRPPASRTERPKQRKPGRPLRR